MNSILKYQASDDTRVNHFKEYLNSMAKFLSGNNWNYPNSQSKHQARNGWYPLYRDLFGLYNNKYGKVSPNVNLILNNQYNKLLANFIKKFQYPFPKEIRTYPHLYVHQEEKGYKFAPLRILVKLLYIKYSLTNDSKAFITDSEFKNGIIANKKLVFPEIYPKYNIIKLDTDIDNNYFQNSYKTNVKTYGDKNNRFFQALLEIMSKASFIDYDTTSHKISLNLSTNTNVKYIMSIVNYKNYWVGTPSKKQKSYGRKYPSDKTSYMIYLQYSHPSTKQNLKIRGKKISNGKNIILFGAPGVGKSYNVEKIIRKNGLKDYTYKKDEDFDNVLRTTLYPDYDYTDFIGQVMPITKNKHISYEEQPGILTKALVRAYQYPNRPIFLVLEEMSRCNIASVFGDIFQLLDRDKNGKSIYCINNKLISNQIYDNDNHKIRIPGNLFIIGTLNTSDQSVYPMDTAFKRRFEWNYISIDDAPAQKVYFNYNDSASTISWDSLRRAINDYIINTMNLREDKQLGQFFINFHGISKPTNDKEKRHYKQIINEAMKGKLLFYLWNDIDKVYIAFNNNKNNSLLNTDKYKTYSSIYKQYHPNKDVLSIFSPNFLKNTLKRYISNDNKGNNNKND